jgi:uncharacterized protein YceK
MRTIVLPLSVLMLTFGCSSQKEVAEPHEHEHGGEHAHGEEGHHDGHGKKHDGDHEGGHHKMAAGPVKDFHDVLAPVFHMEKGAARADAACAAVPSFKEKGAPLATESKEHGAALVAAVAELEKVCASDKGAVEAKLDVVHEAFHKVMESH